MLEIILVILLFVSLTYNLFQYLRARKLESVVSALFHVAKHSHEFLYFLVTASTSPRPTVSIHAVGEEAAEMYQTRLNNLAHSLQDVSGTKRRDICEVAPHQG